MKIILTIIIILIFCFGFMACQKQSAPKHKAKNAIEKAVISGNVEELDKYFKDEKIVKIPYRKRLGGGLFVVKDKFDKVVSDAGYSFYSYSSDNSVKNNSITPMGINNKRYTEEKVSLLYLAAENNQLEIAKLLLKYGENVNDGLLRTTILPGSGDGVIAAGRENEHIPPLEIAVRKGYKEMVQFLLGNNATVNYESLYGYSSLDYAQDEEIKQLLIRYGAKNGSHEYRGEYRL